MEAQIEHAALEPAPEVPKVMGLIVEAAKALNITVTVVDPEYGLLVELSRDGQTQTLLGGRSPLNDAVAARICEDKYYTGIILKRQGYSTPDTARCLKPGHFSSEHYDRRSGISNGLKFARLHGFPLVVKPNRLSHGRDVSLVRNVAELKAAVDAVWRSDYIALVQEWLPGSDLRLNFLDGEFLCGYQRQPGSDTRGDADILNLASGAIPHLIPELSAEWLRYCINIGRVLNLRHFGLDLRIEDLQARPDDMRIIEVNSSPLCVQLYHQGYRAQAIASQIRVLRAIFDLHP